MIGAEIEVIKAKSGRGGRRAGSGRKPKIVATTRRAEKLAVRLNAAIKLGLDPLAERYPDLINTAIRIALGEDEQGNVVTKPNQRMLTDLINLPLKLVDGNELKPTSGGDSILTELFKNRTVKILVEANGKGSPE